jgi:hypothetical protein
VFIYETQKYTAEKNKDLVVCDSCFHGVGYLWESMEDILFRLATHKEQHQAQEELDQFTRDERNIGAKNNGATL